MIRHAALMSTSASLYHRHRFPAEIVSHCIWLYFRSALSFRDVEEMLAMRGVVLTYETVREWCSSSARVMPTTCVEDLLGRALMKCPQEQRRHSLRIACS
jgi:transposase-like protein